LPVSEKNLIHNEVSTDRYRAQNSRAKLLNLNKDGKPPPNEHFKRSRFSTNKKMSYQHSKMVTELLKFAGSLRFAFAWI